MNIIKQILGETSIYRFLSWLLNKYQDDQAMILRPGQFREYGKGVKIDKNVFISMPERVILKDRVSIYNGTMINSQGGLYIGENTGIGYNCTIFTVQHQYRNAKNIPFDDGVDLKPVIIHEFVWTGAGVMIMPGIEIGEGAIIGMGSLVAKSVPPFAIVLGNPAKIIGYRDKEHYHECKEEGRFQEISISKYKEIIPFMYKIRFEKELKELGML
jgi:maltose O-acetyltransferase